MKKKTQHIILMIAIIVAFIFVVFGAWMIIKSGMQKATNKANVEWYDENGTEFVITTADELYGVVALSDFYNFEGQTIKLGADIVVNEGDASEWAKKAPARKWYPITGFKGTFDGQGHSISGIYGKSLDSAMGLFSDTQRGCVIRDFRLLNSYFSGSSEGTGSIASHGGGTFDTIYTDAIIATSYSYAGGLIGQVSASGEHKITNCWFDGTVTMKSEEGIYGGGIAGAISGEGGIITIEHTLNTGTISAEGSSRAVDIGGFCGSTDKGAVLNVTDSLNAGTVQATYDKLVGGVIGDIKSGSKITVSHMYSTQESYNKAIGYQAGSVTGMPVVYPYEYIEGYGGYQWTTLDFEKYWAVDVDATPVLQAFTDDIPSLAGIEKNYDIDWYEEFGTEFTISTLREFYGFYILSANDNFEGKMVKLGADLVVNEGKATSWAKKAPENPWYPINTFAGVFDGQGYTISGVYVKGNSQKMGLFAETTSAASIQNLKLTNSYFEFTDTTMALLGSIAGRGNGMFDTIYSDAILVCSGTGCGGIVGQVNVAGAQISNCWFDGEIQMKGETGRQIGGILGITRAEVDIDHCLNTSKITVETKGGIRAAGILGIATGGEFTLRITDCLTAGRIYAANSRIGAAVGEIQEGKTAIIRDVYAISETLSADEGKTFINKAIGHIGTEVAATEKTDAIPAAIVNGSAVMIPEAGIKGYLGYQWTTLNFDKFWSVNLKGTPILTSFATKSPSVAGIKKKIDISWYKEDAKSYTIKTPEQLNGFFIVSALTNFEGKTVKLGNNITVNSGNASDWATNRPTDMWYPINTFAGTFDGQGHTISGLYMKSATQKIGLFSETTPKAVVKNFRLTNSYMESTSTGMALLGSIAGRGDGTFDTIYSDAIIVCSGTGCGGIVGQIYTKGDNKITNCWYDGMMSLTTDAGKQAGGILGIAREGVTIEHCLNTADIKVEATGGLRVAGILGIMTGGEPYTVTISDCLSAGNITTANSRVGAIVAEVQADKKLVLKDTYALAEGMTTGKASIKKVIGHIDPKGAVSGVAALIPTDLLKGTNAGQWTTLDFGKYWGAKSDAYPELASFTASENITVAGLPRKSDVSWYDMSKNEFVIDSVEDLYGFYIMSVATNFKEQTVKLGADLDVNIGESATWATSAPTNVWYPVNTFAGTFDGQGHRISGLYLKSSNQMIGFFSQTSATSTVKNLKITNSYMESTSTGMAILGSFAGRGNGTFDTIYSNAILASSGTGNGGLVGQTYYKDTKVNNAWFDGSITLTTKMGVQAGGIVGIARESISFNNCLNTGTITVESNSGIRASGILGIMTGGKFAVEMNNCLTTGQITAANSRVGVVIGEVQEDKTLTLNEVYATAESHYDGAKYITRAVGHSDGKINGTGVIVPKSSFTGNGAYLWTTFDFDNVWVAKADSTPELKSFSAGANLPVTGGMRADTSWYEKKDYNIDTLAELYGFAKLSWHHDFEGIKVTLGEKNAKEAFTLNSDGSASEWAEGQKIPANQWISIGTEERPFAGTFDGRGNIISGVYMETVGQYAGLFASVTGTVENLNLTNSYFEFCGTKDACIGSVTGALSGTLQTVRSDAIVYSTGLYNGGLVGSINGSGTLDTCWFDGKVELEKDKCQYGAGLVGIVSADDEDKATIAHCLNTGTITGERTDTTILGLSGLCSYVYNGNLEISDSLHTGTIGGAGTRRVYLVARGETLVNCENTYYSNKQGLDHAVWGDDCTKDNGTSGLTTEALKGVIAKLNGVELNEKYWVYPQDETPQLEAFSDLESVSLNWAGKGTEEEPWIISNANDLKQLANIAEDFDFSGKHVQLGTDEQAGQLVVKINEGDTVAKVKENATENWNPIGSSTKPFAGTFDGNGNTISGLYDKGTSSYRGLFGFTNGCTIKNLKLSNSYIENTATSGNAYLGGIVGFGNGTFENIKCEAQIVSKAPRNGGIIGCIDGATTITGCWYSGDMTLGAKGTHSGGFIGMINSGVNVSMSQCLYDGTITGDGTTTAAGYGGLCGRIYGNTHLRVTDCLAIGSVATTTNSNWIGTLVGYMDGLSASAKATLTVTNTYSSYTKNDQDYVVRTRSNARYLCGDEDIALGNGGVKSRDYVGNVLKKDIKDYDGWYYTSFDFDKWWSVMEDGTPQLKAYAEGTKLGVWKGRGTESSPYILSNVDELKELANYSSTYDFSGKFIDLGTKGQLGNLELKVNECDSVDELKAKNPTNWKPIGSSSKPFAGTFNGRGNKISGVYYKGNGTHIGLFGYTAADSVIKNLVLTNSYFENTGTGNVYMGSIAGTGEGDFECIKSEADIISGGKIMGGLLGQKTTSGTISDCWFAGTLNLRSTGTQGGGIVGLIAGTVDVTIKHCLNSGTITATNSGTVMVGGICGYQWKGTLRIIDSLTVGTITATNTWRGSIIGRMNENPTIIVTDTYASKEDGCQYTIRRQSGTITYNGTQFTSGAGLLTSTYGTAMSALAGEAARTNASNLSFVNRGDGVHWKTGTEYPILKEFELVMINSEEYSVNFETQVLTNVAHRTTLSDFVENLNFTGTIKVYGIDGKQITDTSRFIRSGMTVKQIRYGEVVAELTVLVNQQAINALAKDALDTIPKDAESEMVAGVDQLNGTRVIVYKQNSADWNEDSAVVWEWKATKELGYTGLDNIGPLGNRQIIGIADAKLRYNDFYGGYVVAVACGQGFLGLIDYETKECLYSYEYSTEQNPHAVELLPDGNMVVASSSGNSVTIYASTQGDDNGYYKRYTLSDAHGLLWDPDLDVLWALGGKQLVAYRVGGTIAQPELIRQDNMVYDIPQGSGHDLYPVYGQTDKLWITATTYIYQFNTTTGEFKTDYDTYDMLSGKHTKSIGNQPFSGTIVRVYPTVHAWRTDTIELFKPNGLGNFMNELHTQSGAGYYKGRVWYYEYQ